ncbi:hypothetical protein ACP70R_008584 [Stipagrostis hirtigluma subsp. patula]
MGLWNGMGQAATVAQLAGIDAGGLILMIVGAVQTVRRNKEECQQLVHHVIMISDLVQLLQQSEMMRCLEIKRPLEGLEDTLRQAYMLVTSCQQSNLMYRFLIARNQAKKFHDVRDRIDSYLRICIYPLIRHIDTRYFINGIYSRTHPSGAQPQASEEVPGSLTSYSKHDSRSEGSAFDGNDIEPVEVLPLTEPFAVEEQQQEGYQSTEVLHNRWYRFRWIVQWVLRETSTTQSICKLVGHEGTGDFTVFKFSQLAASTKNFSSHNIIGRGGHGSVYKGVLPNGVHVAVKTRCGLHLSRVATDFKKEIKILPKLHHENIIKLLGCCIQGDNVILVYEYMPRGTLASIIHEQKEGITFPWPIRFQIIEGIAQGAAYLHQHSRLYVVHRDLKPENILLDHDMTPRIADFGLAKLLSSSEDEKQTCSIRGTFGYISPEYLQTLTISVKVDVYAFGVTLLEIITALHAWNPITSLDPMSSALTETSLVFHAWKFWSSGRAMELIDVPLRDEPQTSEVLRCFQIALLMTLPVPRSPQENRLSTSNDKSNRSSAEWMAEEVQSSLLELERR